MKTQNGKMTDRQRRKREPGRDGEKAEKDGQIQNRDWTVTEADI